jgi:hypothetical protein
LKSYLECFLKVTGLPQADQVAQYSIIAHLASSNKLTVLAFHLGFLDRFCCMLPAPVESSDAITRLVHDHITSGWVEYITDIATYRRFNDNRGQWTLAREGCGNLEARLQRPFDECVLVWHLATDFCFYLTYGGTQHACNAGSRCREMSNYMAYLLFVNPEMLMPGARRGLIRAAYDDLKYLHVGNQPHYGPETTTTRQWGDQELARKLIRTLENSSGSRFAHDALALSKELMGIGEGEEGSKKMWRVIQGVWVEMLCFSASRCRGYLHAKSLGTGGQYLSYVWLLLWYMGMETLAERLQRTELNEKGDMGASVQTPQPIVISDTFGPVFHCSDDPDPPAGLVMGIEQTSVTGVENSSGSSSSFSLRTPLEMRRWMANGDYNA